MKRTPLLFIGLLLLLGVAGCTSLAPPAPTPQGAIQRLTVLYTNDEHGWMAGMRPGEGAAELMGLWRTEEGYTDGGPYLVLSGGDNWTGPAISTWFEGESMVEVMNAMGYDAAAVGNHDFDFGLQGLQARLEQARFPYLSANLEVAGGRTGDLGILPYTILNVDDLRVGLIGLTTTATPYTTNPANLVGLSFADYEPALRKTVPVLVAEGVDLILVPAHICIDELMQLAEQVKDLPIAMLGGGHCNALHAARPYGAVVLSGGYHFTGYAYARFSIDRRTKRLVDVSYGTRKNNGGQPDPQVAAIVERWQAVTRDELDVVIGYLEGEIPRRSPQMQRLITGAWLAEYPPADIALTNLGGMRDRLPAGDITLADIISVMPFDNVLVEVRLSGEQLERVLATATPPAAAGGIHQKGGVWFLDETGVELDPDASYSVLVNDFMYAGGDNFVLLAQFDPQAYNTAIDWRQPVIDWILAQESSPDNPLEAAIDRLGK